MPEAQPGRFDFVPVVLTRYENHPQLNERSEDGRNAAESEAAAVGDALAEFGGDTRPWALAAQDRDGTAVKRRLGEWANPDRPRNTVLHWIGHGWSNNFRSSMALLESDLAVDGSGLTPEMLASYIRKREQNPHSGDSWAMVLIDGCRSATFVKHVHISLLSHDPHAPKRLFMLGVSDEGETRIGVFSEALRLALDSFRGSNEVRLWDLADQLNHRLPDPYPLTPSSNLLLLRSAPVVAGANAPLDIYEDLTAFLRRLSPDERLHLIPKARGAEHGDAAWYFVGRRDEKERIVGWLRNETSGMLVVTGEGGQGKSALLGNIAALSRPRLRELLVRGNYITKPTPAETPPDHVFHGIVHATGMSRRDITESIATAAGYPPETLSTLGTASLADSLAASLEGRDRPFTFLVDALDEAEDPRGVAEVLRRLASLTGCCVVVGTRPAERRAATGAAVDLIAALAPDGLPSERLIVLDRDPEAVRTYVELRLRGAGTLHLTDSEQGQTARAIAAQEPDFLGARLAVHEVISRLSGQRDEPLPAVLADLAATGLRDDALFSAAMNRVLAASEAAQPLLLALALSEGRGMPRAGDVWSSAATGLARGRAVTEQDIDTLLDIAAPYVLIDAEDEYAVYRLSHEVFRDLMVARCLGAEARRAKAASHRNMARGLAAAARRRMSGPDRLLPPYVRKHLAAHAAYGHVLEEILMHDPELVLSLDHGSVALHAAAFASESAQAVLLALETPGGLRTSQGTAASRPELPELQLWARRTGAHQLAETCAAALAGSEWMLRQAWWSGVRSRQLQGHTAGVRAVCSGTLGGEQVIVSAADDNTVRLWDETSGRQIAVFSAQRPTAVALTRTDGEETITALCDASLRSWNRVGDERATAAVPLYGITAFATLRGGKELLGATADTLDIRHGPEGRRVGWHHDTVLALAAEGPAGAEVVVSGSADHSARVWDLTDGSLKAVFAGHTAGVLAVSVKVVAEGTQVATAGADRKVIVWDTVARIPRHAFTLPHGPARALSFGRLGGRDVLIAACEDTRVRTWDVVKGTPLWTLPDHAAPVTAVATHGTRGISHCVTGSGDGTIRLWDIRSMGTAHASGLNGAVRALCWTSGKAERPVLLGADSDEGVWEYGPDEGTPPRLLGRHHVGVRVILSYGPPGSAQVVLQDAEGGIWLWNVASGRKTQIPRPGRAPVCTLTVGGSDDLVLATANADGWIHLHDLRAQKELARHRFARPCSLLGYHAGQVVTLDDDGLLSMWNPGTRNRVWEVHTTSSSPRCLSLGPWGEQTVVAIGTSDGEVRLYGIADGSVVDRYPLRHGAVETLAVTELDGVSTVVAGCHDGSVVLWSHAGRTTTLVGHAEPVCTVAPGPRSCLATGGVSGTLSLWTRRDARQPPTGNGAD